MNRRSFLTMLAGGAAALAVPFKLKAAPAVDASVKVDYLMPWRVVNPRLRLLTPEELHKAHGRPPLQSVIWCTSEILEETIQGQLSAKHTGKPHEVSQADIVIVSSTHNLIDDTTAGLVSKSRYGHFKPGEIVTIGQIKALVKSQGAGWNDHVDINRAVTPHPDPTTSSVFWEVGGVRAKRHWSRARVPA